MRMMMLLLSSAMFACGGATSTDLFNSSTDGGGNGTDGGGNGTDGGGNGTDGGGNGTDGGGNKNDGGKDCKALAAQLDQLRNQANACLPNVNACAKTIEDFCCPLTVTEDNSQASKAFEAALSDYKNQQCPPPVCPGMPCRPGGSKICAMGHCLQ